MAKQPRKNVKQTSSGPARPKRNTVVGKPAGKPRRAASKRSAAVAEGKVRIQKYLSDIGIDSRRAIEEMVLEGRIEVNGEPVAQLPCFIMPGNDVITIDGNRVHKKNVEKVYYLMNKPKGVVCSSKDPFARLCIVDLLPAPFNQQRVYCVGRLDADSTGAIILTNDGELTQHLTHPSHEVSKTYMVTVRGSVDGESLEKLKRGVYIDGKRTAGAAVKIVSRGPESTLLEMTLREGKNREIRRTLLRLGYKVRSLKRFSIGPLTTKGLGPGHFRILSKREVAALLKAGER